jgi:hypothetical protein
LNSLISQESNAINDNLFETLGQESESENETSIITHDEYQQLINNFKLYLDKIISKGRELKFY